jgi:hypothetical protein
MYRLKRAEGVRISAAAQTAPGVSGGGGAVGSTGDGLHGVDRVDASSWRMYNHSSEASKIKMERRD